MSCLTSTLLSVCTPRLARVSYPYRRFLTFYDSVTNGTPLEFKTIASIILIGQWQHENSIPCLHFPLGKNSTDDFGLEML